MMTYNQLSTVCSMLGYDRTQGTKRADFEAFYAMHGACDVDDANDCTAVVVAECTAIIPGTAIALYEPNAFGLSEAEISAIASALVFIKKAFYVTVYFGWLLYQFGKYVRTVTDDLATLYSRVTCPTAAQALPDPVVLRSLTVAVLEVVHAYSALAHEVLVDIASTAVRVAAREAIAVLKKAL